MCVRMYVCVNVSVCLSVSVCVCMCWREKERERNVQPLDCGGGEAGKEYEATGKLLLIILSSKHQLT